MPIIAGRASAAYGSGFGKVLGGAAYAGPYGSYESLATVTVGATAVSRIDFNGIPQGYKHLQVRLVAFGTSTADPKMRFNDDASTSNKYMHSFYNNVSAVSTYNDNSAMPYSYNESTAPGCAIIDIFDYANVSKNKNARTISGYDANGAGYIFYRSQAWFALTAINQVSFIASSGQDFLQYSSFALYGIR